MKWPPLLHMVHILLALTGEGGGEGKRRLRQLWPGRAAQRGGGEGGKRQSLIFFPVVGKEIRNATLRTLVHVF